MINSRTNNAASITLAPKSLMARRSLKGLFMAATASTALAGAAGTARATTTTTVSSTPIPIGNVASSWAGKSTKYGEFGAGYSASYALSSNDTGSSKYESVGVAATAKLFGAPIELVDISAKASAGLSSSVTGSYVVKIAGITTYNISSVALSSSSLSVSMPCYTFGSASSQVVIGVVPVTLELTAEGCPGLTLRSSGSYSSSQSSISFTGTPSISADLTASIGVGASNLSIGAEVGVTLISVSLPVTSTMTFVPATKALTYANTGTLTLESLAGSISLYAKAWLLKYTYTLFDWDGIGGSWVVFSDSVPTASSPTATISGYKASGTYTFTDPASLEDNGSTYTWSRATDASGTGSAVIDTNKDRNLSTADSTRYLQFCVKPRNGVNNGTTVCSGWASVGHLAEFFTDGSSGGTNLSVAYEQSTSGTCINVNTSAFNDKASSFQFYAPTSTAATLWLFKDADCSGGSTSVTASANGTSTMASMNGSLGSAWNDSLSSIMVVYGETVTAEDLTTTISGNMATGSYSFVTNGSLTEGSSAYSWRRASSSTGTGSTTISTGTTTSTGTGATHTLSVDDEEMYLSFCITATNGYTSSSQTCSAWTSVGHLVELYKDGGYSGTNVNIAYEKSDWGTCFNMSSYSFNDAMSTFKFHAPSGSTATFQVFYDANCSGNGAYYTQAAGGTYLMPTLNSYWNDNASSFKVTW